MDCDYEALKERIKKHRALYGAKQTRDDMLIALNQVEMDAADAPDHSPLIHKRGPQAAADAARPRKTILSTSQIQNMLEASERAPEPSRRDFRQLCESHLAMLAKMEDLADTAERISAKADRIIGRKP